MVCNCQLSEDGTAFRGRGKQGAPIGTSARYDMGSPISTPVNKDETIP